MCHVKTFRRSKNSYIFFIGIGFEDRHQSSLSGLPIPVGMFLNMAQIPPRFYNQQFQGGQQQKKSHFQRPGMSQENHGSASQVSSELISNVPIFRKYSTVII